MYITDNPNLWIGVENILAKVVGILKMVVVISGELLPDLDILQCTLLPKKIRISSRQPSGLVNLT
jgi:hypothetical protein